MATRTGAGGYAESRGGGTGDGTGGGARVSAGADGRNGSDRNPKMDPNSPEYVGGGTIGAMGLNKYGSAWDPSYTDGQLDSEPNGTPKRAPRETLSIENMNKVGKAYRDYVGMGDSPLDKLANFVAGVFGFREANPTDPNAPNATGENAPNVTGNASWSVDPIETALALGGFANPLLSLASWAYKGMKSLTGWHGAEVAMDNGTSRPTSYNDGVGAADRNGDVGANKIVGVDTGAGRGTSVANDRGSTAVQSVAPAATGEALTEEALTAVTGRNRNGKLLTPAASVNAPVL